MSLLSGMFEKGIVFSFLKKEENPMTWKNAFRYFPFIVFTAILTVISSRMNFQKSWEVLRAVKWEWLISILILNVLNIWIDAVRWKLILNSVKRRVKVFNAIQAILMGAIGNILMPFRLGDGARIYYLSRQERIPWTSIFSTVVLNHMTDTFFFLLLVGFSAFFFSFSKSIERMTLITGSSLVSVVLVLILIIRWNGHVHNQLSGKLHQWVVKPIRRFTEIFSTYMRIRYFIPVVLLFVFSWFLRLARIYCIFMAFHLHLPFMANMVVLIFLYLGIGTASSPANLGGFELAMVAALKLFSLETELAMSCAVSFHFIEVVPVLILGLIVIWITEFRLFKLKRIISP